MELRDRERKVDLQKMDVAQVDILGEQIGAKLREICDEAAAKVNAILNIYGASAKIAIAFEGLEQKSITKRKTPAKRTRKPKQANLK